MTQLRQPLVFALVTALSFFFLFSKRHAIIDRWKLRGYRAPARIQELAMKVGLTDKGRDLFYVNSPRLLSDKTEFASDCSSETTDPGHNATTTLGCYRDFDNGIFLFDVADARLKSAVEVTAAHEILHAAYDRMDEAEKDALRPLLEEGARLNEVLLKERMKPYRDRGPDILLDELHSILGTEVARLPPALELHYATYLTDRSAVVEAYSGYEKEFRERGARIDEYDKQLAILRAEIEAGRKDLDAEAASLAAEQAAIAELSRLQRIEEHNARAQSFNLRAMTYNQRIAALRDLITRHNQLVSGRNEIALETQELAQAIDSRVQNRF